MSRERDTSPSSGTIDLEGIRGLLDKDSEKVLEGVANPDVDWFLRDTDISNHNSANAEKDGDVSGGQSGQQTSDEQNGDLSPVKSHLNAGVSNTNDNFINKSKSTVSPVSPEIVASPQPRQSGLSNESSGASNRRRSSVSSIGSTGSNSGGGFFSKIKNKFSSRSGDDVSQIDDPLYHDSKFGKEREGLALGHSPGLDIRKTTSPVDYSSDQNFKDQSSESEDNTIDIKGLDLTSHPQIDEYILKYVHEQKKKKSCMKKHSLSNQHNSTQYVGMEPISKVESSGSSKIPFFFRKRNSISQPNIQTGEKGSKIQETPIVETSESVHSSDSDKEVNGNSKSLKRVCFHSSTFLIDPPQQIPSRSPRKGNVEVLPNGVVRIHPLTDEDKKAIEKSQLGLGGGLVVGGTGPLGLIKNDEKEGGEDTQKNEETGEKASCKVLGSKDEDPAVDKKAQSFGIEKAVIQKRSASYRAPVNKMALDLMYTRACHLREILPIPAILKQIPKGSMAPLPVLELKNPMPTLIEIQTFADFIRIAPIMCISLDGVSLTLEQFKVLLASMSAKTQLEKLSLRNTPISQEGWSILCCFLSKNSAIRKLDITQCPALEVKPSIKKRKRSVSSDKSDESSSERMTCNKDNRTDMDWAMFAASIIVRGGIEELILTGCCISDLTVFEKLVKNALSIKTSRLGLAYNQITVKQLKIVFYEWLFKDFVRGLDLGYNDLSSTHFLNIVLEFKEKPEFEKLISSSKLRFLSLNANNLRYSTQWQAVFEGFLLKLPHLKYLDLSNNMKLFGPDLGSSSNKSLENDDEEANEDPEKKQSHYQMISTFTSQLPLFPKLIRLHLENNGLDTQMIMRIADVLPFCKHLIYLSILGNKIDLTAASALVSALKNSTTLVTLDCNTENLPDFYRERMGLYAMRNMEKLLYASDKKRELLLNTEEEALNEGKSLTAQFDKILSLKAHQKLDTNSGEVKNFFEKTRRIRLQLKSAISELLRLQLKNKLNIEGKETLFRFIFIDSSIEKGLQLIDSSFAKNNETDINKSLLMMQSAEDEHGREQKSSSLSVPADNTEAPARLDAASSPLSLSRNPSKSNLSMLNKEEGSVLKLSKLSDYHKGSKSLQRFSENMTGEEIREKLLGADLGGLDKIIDYLENMKEKGISLGKVFDMKNDPGNYNLGSEIEGIKHKLQALVKDGQLEESETTEATSDSHASDATTGNNPENHSAPETNNDNEYINEMFDKVLNDLQKFRTE